MREHKFRFYYKNKLLDTLSLKEISERNYHWADDVIVVEYTGLKDKNDKAIYEGDLIRTDGFSDGYSEPIVWRDCMFQIGEHGICPLYPRKDYEVIGNIHENPELLEGE
jgi:hypothetical protein